MQIIAAQLIRQALLKVEAIGEQDSPSPKQTSDAFFQLKLLIDSLNADQFRGAFAYTTTSIDLNRNDYIYPIGPAGTPASNRPVDIVSMNVILGTSTSQSYTVTALTQREYNNISLKANNKGIPKKYFYNPTVETGEIYLYPGPAGNYTLEVTYKESIGTDFEAGDTLVLANGFSSYLMLKLTESLCSQYSAQMSVEDLRQLNEITYQIGANSPEGEPAELRSELASGPRENEFNTFIPDWR